MPRTALVVPVPEADPYYVGPPGAPAHVTILIPFLAPERIAEHELAELAAVCEPFAFRLVAIEQFPDGTRWLRPEPGDSFVALVEATVERWPDHPPYEGAFPSIVPHVTITAGRVPLPLSCRAEVLVLLVEDLDGVWSRRAAFQLGMA